MTNKRWTIVFLMLLSYMTMYLCRSAISISGPVLMKQYGWSATQFGLVSTAFFIGYAITMFPAGWLADRFGSGKVVVTGILFYSLFTILTPVIGVTIGLMIFVRVLVGLGQAATLPSNAALLAQWMPKKEIATAQGIVMIGTPLGIALTMPLGVLFISNFSWQTTFYVFAFVGPVWCILWWLLGRNKPELHPSISKQEIEHIRADQGQLEIKGDAALVTTADVFSKWSVWGASLSYFASNYLFFLFLTWLPTYFANGRGFTLVKSGYYTMVPYIVAIFAYPLGGYLADWAAKKFGHNTGRKIFPFIGMVAAGLFLILGTRANSGVAALALISISEGFLSITQAGYFSMPMVFSPKNAGKIVGLYGFCGTCAGILAPLLTGMIIDHFGKYEYAMYFGALVAVAGALLLFFVNVKQIESKKAINVKPITSEA